MREEHKEKKQNQLIIEDWKKEIREKGSDKAGDFLTKGLFLLDILFLIYSTDNWLASYKLT